MRNLINQIMDGQKFLNSPYFNQLREGRFSKDDFVETQIQFFNAVIFFNRPMTVLAAKIPDQKLRMKILQNVWEEHGEGDESKMHSSTFLEFLIRLGKVTSADVQKRALWPEVRIFNTTLIGVCTLDEYLVGAGVLGIIELMFSYISSELGELIVKNNWLNDEDLIHYKLHKDLDIQHAEDFFAVLKPSWDASIENRYFIEQGMRMGEALFRGLYEDLFSNKKRRWYRGISGPHTRVT